MVAIAATVPAAAASFFQSELDIVAASFLVDERAGDTALDEDGGLREVGAHREPIRPTTPFASVKACTMRRGEMCIRDSYQALCIQLRYEKERSTGRELVHARSTLRSGGGRI